MFVIDNNAKSNQLHDQIFWYKADKHPAFRLGSQEFWDYSKDLDSDDDAPYDPNASRKKSNGPRINVKKGYRK